MTITEETFQQEVDRWLIACFGEEIARDKIERNHRFIEEALELVQAGGCTASEAHQLVDYVYGRPVGDMWQEVGGTMNTLAALCLAYGLDMDECGKREIARCWTKVEKIRAKQAAKPKHSPLPEAAMSSAPTPPAVDASLIGLSIATKYAVGGPGVRLAAEIRDAILSVIAPTPPATAVSEPKTIDGGEFHQWETEDFALQCQLQSREQLDPEFSRFMAALAVRLASFVSVPAREAVEVPMNGVADFRFSRTTEEEG